MLIDDKEQLLLEDYNMNHWTKGLEQARKYYTLHGDLNVSSTFVDEDGYSLGTWLAHQRNKYNGTDNHGKTLSPIQIRELDSIGMIWDKLEYQWDAYYQSARQYYEAHCNLLVPVSFIDENGLKLGQWISVQRKYYFGKGKRGTITSERIKKLESISMIWDPLSVQWESNYALAKRFFEENGHLSVPKNYITDNGTKLGKWIQNQRNKYHHHGAGQLTEDQIMRLNRIGMSWDPYEEEWTRQFQLAKAYFERNGNLLVPLRYSTELEPNLGAWINRQRRKKNEKSGKALSQKQVSLLNSIGMIWNPNEVYFEECIVEAKQYYEDVGDLEIEYSYISPSGKKLGLWIANLRKSYKLNSLSDDRIKKLESIGMKWEMTNSSSQTSFPEQIVFFYAKSVCIDAINRYSELGFELDIFIPSIRIGIEYDGAAWHKDKQADDNKKNALCRENGIELFRLREEKCPQLNGISIDIPVGDYSIQNVIIACESLFNKLLQMGYINSVPIIDFYRDIGEIRKYYKNAKNDSWNQMYREAEYYYKQKGNLEIPFDYITETGLRLGTWITNQRSHYAGYSGIGIDANRVELLEKIGMIWNVPDAKWQKGYAEAQKYFEKYGSLKVNAKYVSNTGYHLGSWIRKQRSETGLSKEQRKKLDDLGMIWDVKDYQWTKNYLLARDYYNTHGDLDIPQNYETLNGENLGLWIQRQRKMYASKTTKKLSPERIMMLNEIGMIW